MEMTINQIKAKMQAALDHLKNELKSIRTGRANPAMLDPVTVEVYGSQMRLRDLASITAPEARQLVITPFDQNNLHPIVKGIEKSNLNLRAIVDGNVVRIKIPEMNAQIREEMRRITRMKGEEAKIAVRNTRRDGNASMKQQQSEGKITEDVQRRNEKEIQELTDKFCKQVDETIAAKEKEITTL